MSKKILIIEARFYEDIADIMVNSAITCIINAGYEYTRLGVPGCFEIPALASAAIKSNKFAGIVALGCIIRGQTTHYDYVCAETAHGLNKLAVKFSYPIGYGIITAENKEQALIRADKKQKDIGGKAAHACITMIKQIGLILAHDK